MTFVGALALRLLVTAPAIGRMAIEEERPSVLAGADRRLLVLAGAAISLLVPATLAELVNKATDKDAGLSFWQSIRPSAIAEYLTAAGPEGALEQLRLLLIALAALVVVPAAAGALRRGWLHRPRLVGRVMVAGLVLASAELIVRAIPTEAPALGWPREIFTRVLDWGHVYASSIWVGGLVGLAVLGASMRTPAVRRGRFWALALRRFSVIATVCVAAMILTGLWITWLHLGPPRLLFHTLYGETLLVKLVLVAILLAVAAANPLWLLPRMDAVRDGSGGLEHGIVLRRFHKTVAAEVVLGTLILLVVPFLSGSARNQDFQARAADLTQTRQAHGHAVSLRPSGAQPGMTDYDVWAPGAGDRVSVAFSSSALDVPETKVPRNVARWRSLRSRPGARPEPAAAASVVVPAGRRGDRLPPAGQDRGSLRQRRALAQVPVHVVDVRSRAADDDVSGVSVVLLQGGSPWASRFPMLRGRRAASRVAFFTP